MTQVFNDSTIPAPSRTRTTRLLCCCCCCSSVPSSYTCFRLYSTFLLLLLLLLRRRLRLQLLPLLPVPVLLLLPAPATATATATPTTTAAATVTTTTIGSHCYCCCCFYCPCCCLSFTSCEVPPGHHVKSTPRHTESQRVGVRNVLHSKRPCLNSELQHRTVHCPPKPGRISSSGGTSTASCS